MNYLEKYSSYLTQRSWLGFVYRKLYLYPRLCKYLKGDVIDVGCGIGDFIKFRPLTLGVDVNKFNIDICISRKLNAQVMNADELAFMDESFDAVLLDNVLEHIQKPDFLLAEIRRILRPDGLLVVGVPGAKGQAWDLDHKVFYNEDGLLALAERTNFIITNFFYMPFFKSDFLSQKLRQYCIYSLWVKD